MSKDGGYDAKLENDEIVHISNNASDDDVKTLTIIERLY